MTVQDLIDQAARLIGISAAGRSLATQEYANSLVTANALLEMFSISGATIYQLKREQLALTGAASYTIGTGGTFNTPRPLKIRAAAVSASFMSMPVEIVSPEKFAAIVDKTVTGSFADLLCCDYAYPLATLYLWPAPGSGNLDLWSIKALTAFAALSDTLSLPAGYADTLKWNLAVALAGEFPGSRLPDYVAAKAQSSLQALGALNAQTLGEPVPPAAPGPQQPLTVTDLEQGSR